MLAFSICTSVIAYALYTLGLLYTKPDVASIAACIDPIVATLIGFILLKQSLDIFQIIGIIRVLSAITTLNVNFKNKNRLQ